MRIGNFAVAAGICALGLALWTAPSIAQGPMYDRVQVNLPYTVTVGDKTLQPGDYVIQQLRSITSANRILLIYSDNGMKFETSAMTIPALDNNTPDSTKVVLDHYGPDYYIDKIWIQGKDYGYEFPVPASVKAREKERMEPVNVTAQYQSVPEPQQTAQNTTTENNTVASNTTSTAESSANRSDNDLNNTNSQVNNSNNNQNMTAQNTTPAPAATPEPAPAPAPPENNNTNNTSTSNSATQNNTANREMPSTSVGWLGMLLTGGGLSGAGLLLKRRRS